MSDRINWDEINPGASDRYDDPWCDYLPPTNSGGGGGSYHRDTDGDGEPSNDKN